MTELSDTDREQHRLRTPVELGALVRDWCASLTDELLGQAARTLITAEIVATAQISEDEMVEAMAEVAWAARGWVFGEQMDHVKQAARAEMRAALNVITPTLAKLAAEIAALRKYAALGENHHNAADCPYCNPKKFAALEDAP